MKRMIALLICGAILLTGCTPTKKSTNHSTDVISEVETTEEVVAETITETLEITDLNDVDISYRSLDDENLLSHIEDLVYSETVKSLDSDKYFVENVSAIYISKEYLEEVAYNSQSNVYFGYTIAELNDLFEGSKYVFTLGEDGTTIVQELVEIEDNDTEQILQNVAIGTGVIFLVMLLLGNVRNNDRYLLIVRGQEGTAAVESTVDSYFNGKAFFRVCNEDRSSVELIYEVSASVLAATKKKHQDKDIKEMLFAINGVDSVNLVCQNDEITR